MKVKSLSRVSNPVDCSLPGSSVHGIFQARVLEWGAIAFSHLEINLLVNWKRRGWRIKNREYWAQEYADTTLVDAVDLAASCIDDGWGYTYSEQTRYNGFAAWAIVFTNAEGEDVVVFVNGTDCYLN